MEKKVQINGANERFVRVREVAQIIGYSVTSVWRRCKDGSFPLPVRIGPGAVAWRHSEIEAWMNSRQVSSTYHA